ncbi:MAG TPA: amidohydrolase family protein [Acidimicrobiia bacterium]|nr:amidohydrolase family protein [Acidimicrobiia bacterium]
MSVVESSQNAAPEAFDFPLTDADEHSTPRFGAHAEYMDPDKKHLAITTTRTEDGKYETLYAGRPARMKLRGSQFQVTFSDDKLEDVGVQGAGGSKDEDEEDDGSRAFRAPVPGSLLNRLNPLKGMDAQERKDFAKQYRELQPLLDNPADRLNVMDSQGIQAAVNYASIVTEYEFEDNFEALYANQRAENRYLEAEWGFNYENRLFTPPVVSMADADAALAEVKELFKVADPPKVIQLMAGPSVHRSPFRPECDPIWSILNEAGTNVCTHLSTVTFYGRQGLEWDEEEVMLGDMNAFQWMMYYGDRPAYEMVAAAVLQGIFQRFPNVKLLLSEQGTVWMPYIVRKMDHAFMMGRKATWGKLEKRPSQYVRDHVLVAPYPEENVDRVVESVGIEPLAFGSDFPHGEGLPDPSLYRPQLRNLDDAQTKAIMHNNLARFLGLAEI